MSVAPLSTSIRTDDPSERKRAADNSSGVAMNAPKNPSGKRWSCAGDDDEVVVGAACAAADAAGGVREGADDEAVSAREAARALKENPNEGVSAGSCVAAAGDDECARWALPNNGGVPEACGAAV